MGRVRRKRREPKRRGENDVESLWGLRNLKRWRKKKDQFFIYNWLYYNTRLISTLISRLRSVFVPSHLLLSIFHLTSSLSINSLYRGKKIQFLEEPITFFFPPCLLPASAARWIWWNCDFSELAFSWPLIFPFSNFFSEFFVLFFMQDDEWLQGRDAKWWDAGFLCRFPWAQWQYIILTHLFFLLPLLVLVELS